MVTQGSLIYIQRRDAAFPQSVPGRTWHMIRTAHAELHSQLVAMEKAQCDQRFTARSLMTTDDAIRLDG